MYKILQALITRIYSKISLAKNKKVIYPKKVDFEVELAFTLNGVNYWNFVNPMKMPYERAMAAAAIFNEFEMRMDRGFLAHAIKMLEGSLNSNDKKTSFKILSLLEERMNLTFESSTIYKVASVYYFTEDENIFVYDPIYNEEKIADFKKEKLDNFFLKLPLENLIPFSQQSNEHTQVLLQTELQKVIANTESLAKEASSKKLLNSTEIEYLYALTEEYRMMLSMV